MNNFFYLTNIFEEYLRYKYNIFSRSCSRNANADYLLDLLKLDHLIMKI